jgi:hypothetical protein
MGAGPVTTVVQRADGRYTVLRPAWQWLVGLLLVACVGAISLVPDGSGERMPVALSLPLCAVTLLGAWRQMRLRVELGPTVRVTNLFRTRVLRWSDIEAFGYDSRRAHVALSDGGRLGISAFSPGPRALSAFDRGAREAVRLMENRRKSRLDNRRGRD